MATFPSAPLPAVTELLVNGTWTDFTSHVRDTDQDPGVVITRGAQSESLRAQPAQMSLTLDNRDGALSTRLPTSTYYGLLGRNTQVRNRLRWFQATFSGSASNGWATADSGQTWATSGGSASDYAENGGLGKHTLTTVSTARNCIAPLPVASADAQTVVVPSATATGDHLFGGPCISDGTTNNLYQARVQFRSDSTVWLEIIKRVAGVQTTVKAAVQVGSYSGGTQYTVRIQRYAGYLRAAAYLTSSNPTATTWTLVSDNPETELTDLSSIILRSQTGAANTNVNPVIAYDNAEANSYRFWGEIPAWPQEWDVSGAIVSAPIEAAGIMRRLSAGTKQATSAMYRTLTGVSSHGYLPFAHWSLEDGANAVVFAASTPGVNPLYAAGAVLASDSTLPGAKPVPTLVETVNLTGRLPAYTDTGQWVAQVAVKIQAENFGTGVIAAATSSGSVVAGINLGTAQLALAIRDLAENIVNFSFVSIPDRTGKWTSVAISSKFHASGSNDTITATALDNTGAVLATTSYTAAGIHAPILQPYANGRRGPGSSGSYAGLTVWTSTAFVIGTDEANHARAMSGWSGETAAARLTRLCREANISLSVIGDPTKTQLMGAQQTATLLSVLQDCADADQGILHEPRDAFGLLYRTNRSLTNQVGPALDYSAGRVVPPLLPTDDDRQVRNYVTASRPTGSSAVARQTTGTLSTQDPPNGVGVYDDPVTVNVATDSQLPHAAGWQVRLGAWDEARYPQVSTNFVRLLADGQVSLAGRVAAMDVGDYFSITSPPAWLPPDAIELITNGYRETHRQFEWSLALNCTPAGPYNVFITADQTDGRLDTDGSILSAGVNSGATSLTVASTAGPEWIITGTRPGDFPFSIGVAGERMTVTAADSSMVDNFGRTVSGGWGSATSGQAYTLMGTAANFNTTGSKGTIAPSATGNDRIAYVTLSDDGTYRRAQVNVSFDALPASGSLRAGLAIRMVDVNNFYAVSASITSTGALSLQVDKRVASVLTTIATIPTGITLVPATEYTLLAEINRSTITGAICIGGGVQRPSLTLAVDTDLATGTLFGCYGRDASASATHTFSYDALRLLSPQTFTVTRSANTVSKSQVAGAAVSLWRPSALAL